MTAWAVVILLELIYAGKLTFRTEVDQPKASDRHFSGWGP